MHWLLILRRFEEIRRKTTVPLETKSNNQMIVVIRDRYIGQIHLFEIMFKIIFNCIYTLALKTWILQLNMEYLLVLNDCVDKF